MTVRAIAPISSFASVEGMSTLLSPAASLLIAPERRRSGLAMLRPMNQLRTRPRPTTAMPMPMINSLVCCCDGATACAAASVFLFAEATISSAAGSICRVSAEITARERPILPELAIQSAKASA